MLHSVRFVCVLDTNVIYPLWVRDLMLLRIMTYTPQSGVSIFLMSGMML